MRRIESRFMVLVLHDLPEYKLTQGTIMSACNVLTVGSQVQIESWGTTIQLHKKDIQIFKNEESEPISQLYIIPNKNVKVSVLGLEFIAGESYAIKAFHSHKAEWESVYSSHKPIPISTPETWFTARMLDDQLAVLRWNDFDIKIIDQ